MWPCRLASGVLILSMSICVYVSQKVKAFFKHPRNQTQFSIDSGLGKKRFQREREITYKYTKETFKK
jgi:hypothetical protein